MSSLLASRLTSQRLSGEPATSVLEATRHLLAVQAQDLRGMRLAMRARTAGGHCTDVDRALTQERSLIVTWVNRGTLHLICSEDEPLLHALSTPQLRSSSERRLRQEGVSEPAAERGVSAIINAIADQGPLTRSALRAVLERAQVPPAGQALVHVLFKATLDGLIVRGPIVGSEQAFVLVADWIGERRKIDRDRALAELARRYLVGHGPADERDLARWAQLPLRDARAGFQAIARELDGRSDGRFELRGRPRPAPLPPPRLLGPFEPVLLGWRSREFILGNRVDVVTVNGIFKPIVLVRGRAAGTWTMPKGRVKLDLWVEQPAATRRALDREVIAVEEYLGARPGQ